MSSEMMKELEDAAHIIMAPPNMVSHEQRRAAENIFMDFRKTKSPYAVCRQILENSSVGFVLFEAAEAIKRALIREWSFLQESDIISLRQYLVHYITNKPDLPPFVQDRLLQVVAIMVKRASVDDFGRERSNIINEVENLIVDASPQKQILGCKIIQNLLQEYAVTVKSTDVGLIWEEHFKAKKQFEATDLKRIFKFCVQVLSEIMQNDTPYSADMLILLKNLLSITERILSWGYISAFLRKRIIGLYESVYESDQAPALRLGCLWKNIMLAPQLIPLMFQVYWKVREHSDLSQHAVSCLVQFATLNGGVFTNDSDKMQYIMTYMENFLKLTSSVNVKQMESLGISNIVRKFELFFGDDLEKLPRSIQESYLDELTRLTCAFAEGAAKEEYESAENKYYVEAFDNMLEAWSRVLKDFDDHKDLLAVCATRIFNVYLQCHLAPPEGLRRSAPHEVEEIEDNEGSDRIKFKDQLLTIGMFGRIILDHALPILYRLLEERIISLRSRIQSMQAHPMTINESAFLDNLFEDIHWIVLIAGHILCMHREGETPEIPPEVMTYSVQQNSKGVTNLQSTLKTMAGIQQFEFDRNCIEQCDRPIRMFCDVLRLCNIETAAAEVKLGHFMSPEVGCTLMWFLNRWCTSYVPVDESIYEEISPAIVGALGCDTEGCKFIMNYILGKIQSNICHYNSEPVLLRDSITLFSDMSGARLKSTFILKCDGLWNLVNQQAKMEVRNLPSNALRGLFKGFTLISGVISDIHQLDTYYTQVLKPVQQRFKNLVCRENFNRVYQEEAMKAEFIDILECLIGMAQGAQMSTVQALFDFLSPMLSELPVFVNLYNNYQVIVQLILELFGQCARCMLCYLSESDSRRLYESTLAAIQIYARCNVNRLSSEVFQEDSNFQDLILVLELLTNILSKDCLDLCPDNTAEEVTVTAADVCLFGINFIMPLMTYDLLKYPTLCAQFYRLIVLINDIFPEKICTLPEDLLDKLLTLVEMGLTQFGTEIVQQSLDFLHTTSFHLMRNKNQHNSMMFQKLMRFLTYILDLVMTQQINTDLISIASTSIYMLICCYEDEYRRLVQNLVQMMPDHLTAERLSAAFAQLTENVQLNSDRQSQLKFRDNFDKFIANVQGFLLTK